LYNKFSNKASEKVFFSSPVVSFALLLGSIPYFSAFHKKAESIKNQPFGELRPFKVLRSLRTLEEVVLSRVEGQI
jgi:hypothetical protein